LILIHRPRPKASGEHKNGSENDSEICSAASNAIAGIFEVLWKSDRLKSLWMSEIHTLFTAVLQTSVELKFQNPVLAVNALHRFDVILSSIRGMAEYWDEAQLLLHLFESSPHAQYAARLRRRVRGQDDSSVSDHPTRAGSLAHSEREIQETHNLGTLPRTDDICNSSEDGHEIDSIQEDWNNMFTNEGLDMEMPLDAQWREIYWHESDMSGPLENILCGWT
jgi:transcriptional regulatory protein AMDR